MEVARPARFPRWPFETGPRVAARTGEPGGHLLVHFLEEFTARHCGRNAWRQVVDAADAAEARPRIKHAPQDRLTALIRSASCKVGTSPADLARWFGREAIGLMAEQGPSTLESCRDVRSLVAAACRLIGGTQVCADGGVAPDEAVLRVVHRAPGQFCAVAEGLIEGAARRCDSDVVIDHSTCRLRGADACVFVCTLEPRLSRAR